MSRGTRRRLQRNTLTAAWVAHSRDLRESVAWACLPDNARRVLDRLELEHMRHGGAENGSLPCTYADFEKAGIRRASVALAIRQCVALGFVEVTTPGYRAAGGFKQPSLYRLTHVMGCGKSPDPTHNWQRIKTFEDARAALDKAARAKLAVATQGKNRRKPKKQNAGRENAPLSDALARLQRTAA